jgi:hypothetical protein
MERNGLIHCWEVEERLIRGEGGGKRVARRREGVEEGEEGQLLV